MSVKKTIVWALIDVLVVLIFAFQGRTAHHSGNSFIGVLDTAWPFVVGLALGWVITRQWRDTKAGLPVAFQIWPAAAILTLVTWGVGLLLRVVTDHTNNGAFPLVALGFLTLMFIGWRVVWGSVVQIREKKA